MKKAKAYRLMLYVPREFKPDRDSTGIQVFQFHFVIRHDSGPDSGKVRNCGGYETPDTKPFDSLEFRAQADGKEKKVYGWDLTYRNMSVDLPTAEMCLKMLKRIAKIKTPIMPLTYGQYIQMVCQGLGVEGAVAEGENTHGGFGYDAYEHSTFGAGDIQWLVDRRIGEFFDKHGEALEAARVRWSAA